MNVQNPYRQLCSAAFVRAATVAEPIAGSPGRLRRGELGQGTVEYALILLGAAAVALALVAWVSRTDLIGRLFDTVVGRVLGQAE